MLPFAPGFRHGSMPVRLVLAAALLFAVVSMPAAQADCEDDIAHLQDRLAAENPKAPNIGAAKKELTKADTDDELQCRNAVARAWRAYRTRPSDPPGANTLGAPTAAH